MSTPANANGHRRRELRARVKAEEDACGICDHAIDKSLNFLPGQHGDRCASPDCRGCIPDPDRAEVDEIIPRAVGGSPLARGNVHLTHRRCNQLKGDKSLGWARAAVRGEAQPASSPTTLVDW